MPDWKIFFDFVRWAEHRFESFTSRKRKHRKKHPLRRCAVWDRYSRFESRQIGRSVKARRKRDSRWVARRWNVRRWEKNGTRVMLVSKRRQKQEYRVRNALNLPLKLCRESFTPYVPPFGTADAPTSPAPSYRLIFPKCFEGNPLFHELPTRTTRLRFSHLSASDSLDQAPTSKLSILTC